MGKSVIKAKIIKKCINAPAEQNIYRRIHLAVTKKLQRSDI